MLVKDHTLQLLHPRLGPLSGGSLGGEGFPHIVTVLLPPGNLLPCLREFGAEPMTAAEARAELSQVGGWRR